MSMFVVKSNGIQIKGQHRDQPIEEIYIVLKSK
jgi:hypothetical protein